MKNMKSYALSYFKQRKQDIRVLEWDYSPGTFGNYIFVFEYKELVFKLISDRGQVFCSAKELDSDQFNELFMEDAVGCLIFWRKRLPEKGVLDKIFNNYDTYRASI